MGGRINSLLSRTPVPVCLLFSFILSLNAYSYPGDVVLMVLCVNLDEMSFGHFTMVVPLLTRSIWIWYETASSSRSYGYLSGSIGRSTLHTMLEGSRINEDTADVVIFACWELELWQFL